MSATSDLLSLIPLFFLLGVIVGGFLWWLRSWLKK